MSEITKILVANRGEIALRVMRTARELGISTVAVHSPIDANAAHVRFADEVVDLGGDSASENYLDIQKLVDACAKTGADAVHPGYGFLSERADFVEALTKANVTFIGPPAPAITTLGDKVASKEAARKAGVPVVPGLDKFITTFEEAKEVAEITGYPLIIKAAFGGGGMGMLVVEKESELEKSLIATQKQAKAAFGRGEVFIEKFIGRPRHIEFQMMGDQHGNIVHFGERECSIQRRHQKLIEEAPSPVVTEEERQRVGGSVAKLLKDVGYTNAGTAEFLWEDGTFFFNEVNTRLQVEHPVTEQVYGIDLVREQIRIANGEELGYDQDAVNARKRGWSIECRINAEDPGQNFMPTPGVVKRHNPPMGSGVRVDTFLYPGFQVPAIYDSMVAKLITYGADRPEAIRKMSRALDEYDLGDLVTNKHLHKLLMSDEAFQAGDMTTKYLDEHRVIERYLGVAEEADEATKRRVAAIAAALSQEPGGIDAWVAKNYGFGQSPGKIGVDAHGRRRLNAWGHKGRRESSGGML
jgi:acetyl-CoA carboxylase biotin carboxylase subunit